MGNIGGKVSLFCLWDNLSSIWISNSTALDISKSASMTINIIQIDKALINKRVGTRSWYSTSFQRLKWHCVNIWNCRYLDFYQWTNFVSQFLLWSSIRICLQSSHNEDYHYISLCCECQSLSMPNKACPKVQSFLVF